MCRLFIVLFAVFSIHADISKAAGPPRNAQDPLFLIPRIANLTIDGDLADWQDKGLLIDAMAGPKGTAWTKATPPATVKLAWDDEGLVIGVVVHQKIVREHEYVRHLFKGDSVEIFLSTKKGSHDRYMLVVSPGLDPKFPQPRHCFFADPAEENEKFLEGMTLSVGRRATPDGYAMELKLPWKNLGVEPAQNLELGLQIYVIETDETGKCHTAMWHPAGDIRVPVPMTIRHLYTHMNGLRGEWGDDLHDTEEIVSGYYSTLPVGTYSYNSVGFALGGKLLEAVSGEAFPQFAKAHLLDPLKMTHTEMSLSASGIRTTALDFARFGQMLLNRGSYGNLCFFSEDTYRQMLPIVGGSWGPRSGIGVLYMDNGLLGKGTFGHWAGNSSTLWVDPEHDLLIVMASAGPQRKFAVHNADLLTAVVDGLEKPQATTLPGP